MARRIPFSLKMADGALVRTIEELREHFDLVAVLGYYEDGRLSEWLADRYYDEEADKVRALDKSSEEFKKYLCDILGVTYSENEVDQLDIGDIARNNERRERLKQFTADDVILAVSDHVAFTQEELTGLLDKGVKEVYLCGERFTIPCSVDNITYIGVNHPAVEFDGEAVGLGIDFQGLEFNIRDYIDHFVGNLDCTKNDYAVNDNHSLDFYSFFEKDPVLGVKLLRKEVEKESARAETILGLCYVLGFGVKESIEEASMWLEKATMKNYVLAQYWLGKFYYEGVFGGDKNYEEIMKEAVKWLKKAAEQGYAPAQYELGEVYYYGDYPKY